MVFSSSVFMLLFLPAVLLIYYVFLKKSRKAQNIFLFFASLFFYAWGEPAMVFVMLASIVWNWLIGLAVTKNEDDPKKKKAMLIFGIFLNIALLFVFKYLMFTLENLNLLLGTDIVVPKIALPIGISFFTFQGMSYILDIYYGRGRAQKNLLYVGLYISLFPQLIAGPIVRYDIIADQIDDRKESFDDFSSGVSRFTIGLAKKVILANLLAVLADASFDNGLFSTGVYGSSAVMAWLGAIAYTFQIYFDFSGYSDMAIGLGRMFGFHFEENFNYPYTAKNMTGFWRRWHISLSSWFRDYVYIPLGGSRVSSKGRLIFNMGIVWLLTGIWHGANWTFIVWGLLHFTALMLEKLCGFDKKGNIFTRIYTAIVVIAGWVIFRSDSLEQAGVFFRGMLGMCPRGFFDAAGVGYALKYAILLVIALLCSTDLALFIKRKLEGRPVYGILRFACTLLLFAVSFIYILNQSYNPFIYFNF